MFKFLWQQPLRYSPGLLGRPLLLGIVAAGLATLPANSAERIQFFYGPFEPTIEVKDLQHLAETGEAVGSLRMVSNRLNPDQLAELQSFLTMRFDIDSVMMSQLTYSTLGEHFLQRAGEIVQTDNFLNGFYALRAALIFGAAEGDDLTVLNVIHHFPLETIQLNLPLALEIVAENQQLFQKRDETVAMLRQQAANQALSSTDLSSANWMSPDPRQTGDLGWQVETFQFQTPGRSTPSTAHLYRPVIPGADDQSIPVVVISHGMASSYQSLTYLAAHLASHGYAVVLPEHAETTPERFSQFVHGLAGPPNAMTLAHRPRDISAVLDMLTQHAQQIPSLQALDFQSVGVIGQSLGGYTALAAAGAELNLNQVEATCQEDTLTRRPMLNLSMLLQCRFAEIPPRASLAVQDPRVRAAIAINPLTSHVFGETGLATLNEPVMIVSGINDYFVPALSEQIEPFNWLQSSASYLVIMENGTHFSALDSDDQGPLPVPDFLLGPDPALAQPQLKALTLAFLNRYLLEQAETAPYLNQTYLNTFDVEPFQFSIIQKSFSREMMP